MGFPEPAAQFSEPRTRAEAVADVLRKMIMSGELAPGTRLRQMEVAERFSVSTTPVREAFTSLAREGFVRQDAHRGVEVFRPTAKDIHENYEIRLALEPLATELAAQQIDAETLAEVEGLQEQMEPAMGSPDAIYLNRSFHFAIYRAADRPVLVELIERLRQQADPYIQILGSRSTAEYNEGVIREHRAILAALREHDPRRAHLAMTEHLSHSLSEIGQVIDETGDQV